MRGEDRDGPLDLNAARAAIAAEVRAQHTERVALTVARGRVPSRAIAGRTDLPPFDGSARDGFAVRAADTVDAAPDHPVRLRIRGESRAGAPSPDPLRAATAMRISTGAPLPDRADAIIAARDAWVDGVDVVVTAAVVPGHHVRPRGDDIRSGVTVIHRGHRLTAGDCGAIAALGITELEVHRAPRVAIVGTGDEFTEPGADPAPGQIHDADVPMLEHLVSAAGGIVTFSRARVSDERGPTEDAVSDALAAADVVVITGGISDGAHDHVRPALESRGVRQVFRGVGVRPGRPTWFGVRDRAGAAPQLVFGLPGNPASAFTSFHLFVAPALDACEGVRRGPTLLPAIYRGGACGSPAGLTLAIRCTLSGEGRDLIAQPTTGNQGSHSTRSLIGVDGLILVPPGITRLTSGDPVTVLAVDG